MGTLADLSGGPQRASRPSVGRARVTRAPGAPDDSLEVVLINYSAAYKYDVPAGNWMPRGDDLPTVNAACIVTFDDDGDAWVPAWSPYPNEA